MTHPSDAGNPGFNGGTLSGIRRGAPWAIWTRSSPSGPVAQFVKLKVGRTSGAGVCKRLGNNLEFIFVDDIAWPVGCDGGDDNAARLE